jgi:hypothetical protein
MQKISASLLQPEFTDTFSKVDQLIECIWFGNKAVSSQIIGIHFIAVGRRRGENNNGNMLVAFITFDFF